jgi:formylglycine-generating enzyme required for sulfatase activity
MLPLGPPRALRPRRALRRRRLLGLALVSAGLGASGGLAACGDTSGILFFDGGVNGAEATPDAGNDGSETDATLPSADSPSDSPTDVSSREAGDGRSFSDEGEVRPSDATPETTVDVVSADVAFEASPGAADAGPLPPSCAPGGPGMTNCGYGGSGSGSCGVSLRVEGGTFYRTYDNDGGGPTNEANPATLSSFQLDKYLVTVGRFRQFVAAWNGGAGYLPAAASGKHIHLNGGLGLEDEANPGIYETGWSSDWNSAAYVDPTDANLTCGGEDGFGDAWTPTPSGQENLPIGCVSWYEAYAFCIWDGGFLPSEAEWEYAAAAGSQQREFPWGSVDPGDSVPSLYVISEGGISDVGYAYLGVGYWGQYDLVGEVFEWSVDAYAPYSACTDCANLTASASRVVRGGDYLFPAARNSSGPKSRFDDIGFRCARSP